MKKYFLLFFFSSSLSSFSQTPYSGYIPFPEDSAQWSVKHIWNSGSSIYTAQYKMKGDTLINGISYNKIYSSSVLNYWANDTVLHCFIRQDTALKKVYVRYPYSAYNDSSEFVLYDFDIHTGDTILYKVIASNIVYPLVVTGEDTIQFNTDFRRILYIETVDSCSTGPPCLWGGVCDHGQYWAEGMGSQGSLFMPEVPVAGCDSDLYITICFWHNGYYVSGGTFCDEIVNVENPFEESPSPIVFPNPISEYSYLDFSGKEISYVQIYNFLGEQIKEYHSVNNILPIYSNEYKNGSYILKATARNSAIYFSRFTVIK